MKIRIGIAGYGNLGRGVEYAAEKAKDTQLVALFTRRDPASLKTRTGIPVFSYSDVHNHKDDIDVLIVCGGSAKDLPVQTPDLARSFNVIDSFDTHADIPSHFDRVDKACRDAGHIGIISCGWDPGLFSLSRLYSESILPDGTDYTFWGRGISQGHSDAIRQIKGVKDARQYTNPVPSALEAVRNGETPAFTAREKHTRECYVVAEPWADKDEIEKEIKNMPNYFSDYDTTVTFISEEEMKLNHSRLPHGGVVIRSGRTGRENENRHVIEFKLDLDSNPEFTSSVLVAYARAAYRMHNDGISGAKTVFDIPPSYLHPDTPESQRKRLL